MKESLSPEELEKRMRKVRSERTKEEMVPKGELDASTSDEEIGKIFSMDGVKKGKDWDKVHDDPKERS